MDVGAAGPTRVAGLGAGVTGCAIKAAGSHVARMRGCAIGARVTLARVGSVMAGVAAARGHGRMIHRVGGEARRGIGVAIAALDAGHGDMRRRGIAGRGCTVVAVRAVRIRRLMDVSCPRPSGKADSRLGVAGDAVQAVGGQMASIRRGALCALRAFCRVRTIVAGVATAGAHRRVRHRVGDEARSRVAMAVAALNAGHRNMWRRRQAGRRRAVVAVRAVRVGWQMYIKAASPAQEARIRMTGDAIPAASRDVTRERRSALRTLGALTRKASVVAGVATAGAHRRVRHRVGDEARGRVGMAVAALDAGHRNVRRRR